jgi:cell division protein FtsN
MYCENCQLEIKDQGETRCPLCGNQLRESSAEETMAGNAAGIDFNEIQDATGAFVLDDDDSGGMDFVSQPAQEMSSRGTGRDMPAEAAARAQTARPVTLIDDSTTDMLDQALEEYDPMVDEHFKVEKAGSKSKTSLLLVVLLICVLGAGGYYYFFMMREPAPPAPVAPVKIAKTKKPDAVLDKVLKKEKAPAESGQPATADNATHAAKKPEPGKPAQTAEKKIEEPVAAEPQAPEAKSALPAAVSQTPEKVPYKDKKQPAVVAEKTEELPPTQHGAEPPPAPVMAQDASREAGKAAGAEQIKKTVAPTPAPAEKPASVGAGHPVFTVLTGSFRTQSNADAEVQRLRTLGYDAHAVKVDLKAKGVWTRVLIGSWTNRAEARQMAEDVRRKTNKKDASVIVME